MSNFIEGIVALLLGLRGTLVRVADYPLFWGFATGFLTSTLVHAFLMTDSPRQVPTVLFNDKSVSFEKLYARRKDGTYGKSYTEFSRAASQTKLFFAIAGLLIVLLVLIVMLT